MATAFPGSCKRLEIRRDGKEGSEGASGQAEEEVGLCRREVGVLQSSLGCFGPRKEHVNRVSIRLCTKTSLRRTHQRYGGQGRKRGFAEKEHSLRRKVSISE